MSNKNEYLDNNSDIFQDAKFASQFKSLIKPVNKISLPTEEEIKVLINNLKIYSELPDDLHNDYANSPYINELCEYYEYLHKRSLILKK
jgi:hypothetical protein